jgi:DNA recombination protein RmuC
MLDQLFLHLQNAPGWTLYSAMLACGLAIGLLIGGLGKRSLHRQLVQQQEHNRAQEQRYTELDARSSEREIGYRQQLQQLESTRGQFAREFENLAHRIFEDRSRQFNASSKSSLEDLLQPFREQIGQFQQRVNQVHTEAIKGQGSLEAEIRKVLDIGLEMNTQATNLSQALKGDKKTTGNWGEAQLERSLQLAGLQPGVHYESQAAFTDQQGQRRFPDFIIHLPDSKHMVIDSKVSLVDYDRAVAATEEPQRLQALDSHAKAVRKHIEDLAAKNYALLPGLNSPDFVLMFMPIEPAYMEALQHQSALFDYGFQRGVILVSHTTLGPIMRTVANLWRMEEGNREAREISQRAGELYNQVCVVAERLDKLGGSLKAAGNHYNDTLRSLSGRQGLQVKVERFQTLSSGIHKAMPTPQPIDDETFGPVSSKTTPWQATEQEPLNNS